MFGTVKHKAPIWCVIISAGLTLMSCDPSEDATKKQEAHYFRGNTQGTTYEIIVADEKANFTNKEIDSLLAQFDASLSTYIPSSVISRLNEGGASTALIDQTGFFKTCYLKSKEIYQITNGAFDPSVFPLVKGWGFMDNVESPLSQTAVDSLLEMVGFDQHHEIGFSGNSIQLTKTNPGFKLDFNAIAQGYSVDVLGDFLEKRGQKNYYIEIGGELLLRGKNASGTKWNIGIDVPEDHSATHAVENVISISNRAVATSGSYRKFYDKDGQRFAHFLNPKTGFPVQHSLLSVTVIAPTCAEADAYATAFMVIGAKETLNFVKKHPELKLDVYLLESDGNQGFTRSMSPGFKSFLNQD